MFKCMMEKQDDNIDTSGDVLRGQDILEVKLKTTEEVQGFENRLKTDERTFRYIVSINYSILEHFFECISFFSFVGCISSN